MKKLILNLQMFGEGGDGGASGSTSSTGANSGSEGSTNMGSGATQGEDLSDVIYGKSNQNVADSTEGTKTANVSEDKSKTFEEMIKKGGEFAEEFNKRTQKIIDKRFAQAKEMENTLKSHESIMQVLANKYGVDSTDAESLLKAIDDDDSMWEQSAFEEGLTVKQYKEKLALERENQALKQAEEKARQAERTNEIYAGWLKDSEALAQKYGLQNFDLTNELNNNPDMVALLANPKVTFEAAYMATHFDDILGGAMAQTAQTIEQKVANRIASRQSRPNELGVSSNSTSVFKSDVDSLTNSDIDEIVKRVRRGERISF